MASLFFSFLLSASFLEMPPQNDPHAPIQFSPGWTSGFVILESNDTVACTLRFNQMVTEGLLQVLDGENVLTLSVKDVKAFVFFDPKKARYRTFLTLSVPLNSAVKREIFLEYVYGNEEVSILNHKTVGYAHAYMEFSPLKQATPLNKQYLLDSATGRLLPLSKENALSILNEKQKVETFINDQGIRFKKVSDYVKVFEYHQSL
jgi:hypothetical protein